MRWDDIDLPKRTIIMRRLKGSTDSVHYLERDEVAGLKRLQRAPTGRRHQEGPLFANECGEPFGRMGIGRMIERAGEAAGLPFPVHVHMLRHSTGYALGAGNGYTAAPALPGACLNPGHVSARSGLAGEGLLRHRR